MISIRFESAAAARPHDERQPRDRRWRDDYTRPGIEPWWAEQAESAREPEQVAA